MKGFYTFILAALISLDAFGQTPFFQQYFLLGKNEPVAVNTIFQDRSGILWYGTNKGLFSFDGVNQKRYVVADKLPDDHVTAITQDSKGRIWTGHKNGKLAVIENGTISQTGVGPAKAEISSLLFNEDGTLWISTLGDGIYYLLDDKTYHLDESASMPDLFVYNMAHDAKGNIWAGTDGGIAICTRKGSKVSVTSVNSTKGLPDNIIRKVIPGPDGSMWLGTEDAGIVKFEPAGGTCTALLPPAFTGSAIADFLVNGDQVWISTQRDGLFVYNIKTGQLRKFETKGATEPVNKLFMDWEGNVWTGTSSGLRRCAGNYPGFIDSLEPSRDGNILALAADKRGGIWFANSKGLFRRSVDKAGTVSVDRKIDCNALYNSSVISLCTDNDGFVWAGLYGEGVLYINPENGSIRRFKKELSDGNVLNISCRDNTIWLATLGGATRIMMKDGKADIKKFTRQDGLTTEYIYQVFTDSKNRVWFATDGKGVTMMDQSGFHQLKDGLNKKVIYGFAEDRLHRIWANVQGDGIYLFDGTKFSPYTARNAMRDKNVSCLSADENGNLVMMHDLGMEILDLNNNKYTCLGEDAGVVEKKPNLNAVSRSPGGELFFGTSNGIVVYGQNPAPLKDAPMPLIESLRVNNRIMNQMESSLLKYDQNDVTFNYVGLWFRNTGNLQFRYKLENYDNDWISSRNNSATYSSLPPGNYEFRLKASDSETFLDAKEITVPFEITPPFWKTNVFYFFSACGILLFSFVFLRFRERKLMHDKKILETKNAELRKMNMELDKFVYSVSHDLRAPLLSMKGVVDITTEESADTFTVENMKMLSGSINRLDSFIGEILEFSRNTRTEVKRDIIDLRKLTDDVISGLDAANNGAIPVKIRTDISGRRTFCNDRERISLVLHNLVLNSIQYRNTASPAPFVKIQVVVNDKEAQVEVEDNGIGIREEHHAAVFEMFTRISEISEGPGLGLYNVKEAMDKLKGTISISSAPGVGTKISLRIPNMFYQ